MQPRRRSNSDSIAGKTTRVASSESETRYTSFDYFGQLVTSEQRTPFGAESAENADPKVSGYEYDAFGRLLSQTYPTGRKVEEDAFPVGLARALRVEDKIGGRNERKRRIFETAISLSQRV